jgi:hypothetical protein
MPRSQSPDPERRSRSDKSARYAEHTYTTLNVVIASAADPHLVSAALIEGLAATVAQKVPDAKQCEVPVEVVRLLRNRLQLHGVI